MGSEKVKEEMTPTALLDFMKVSIRTEEDIARHRWPQRSGFVVDEYKQLNKDIRQGQDDVVLPHHRCPVKDDFLPYITECSNIRPLPNVESKKYGWKYKGSKVHPTFLWDKPNPYGKKFFHHQMKWPEGSVD